MKKSSGQDYQARFLAFQKYVQENNLATSTITELCLAFLEYINHIFFEGSAAGDASKLKAAFHHFIPDSVRGLQIQDMGAAPYVTGHAAASHNLLSKRLSITDIKHKSHWQSDASVKRSVKATRALAEAH